MFNDALYMISRGKLTAEALIENANYDLKAVTDNDPFFYKFELGLPPILTFLFISLLSIHWTFIDKSLCENSRILP